MTTTSPVAVIAPRLSNRKGFTLVEVVVAAVILTAALLAMAGFTVKYQQTDSYARMTARAQELANQRLEAVRTATPYASLDTMVSSESALPGSPGFSRTTQVTRVGGTPTDTVDYKIVTVRVQLPGARATISKTSFVGAF
ncbi:MAG: prepilin-type N-terminal cleavage/methylation domain-containing protein [Gemmatimonadaceae bacterium]|nr:prepilin-type N-terminal cleavage/methylation domain-containing protein [Gemmatimonadaceae bacterium]